MDVKTFQVSNGFKNNLGVKWL